MHINEIIVESQQLEEGWKQTLGALTMAAGAAVGGGYSGDADAATPADVRAVESASLCAGILGGSLVGTRYFETEDARNIVLLRTKNALDWAFQLARETGVPKNVVHEFSQDGAKEMEKLAKSQNPRDIERGTNLVKKCFVIAKEMGQDMKDIQSNSKPAAKSAPQSNPQPKAQSSEPKQQPSSNTTPERTIIYNDGAKYVGQVQNGEPNGQGVLTYTDGSVFKGTWRGASIDNFVGYGTVTNGDGGKYAGEWKNSNYNGKGKLTDAQGGTYVGEFKDGQFHGRGVATTPDGRRFEGEFRNGKFVGR